MIFEREAIAAMSKAFGPSLRRPQGFRWRPEWRASRATAPIGSERAQQWQQAACALVATEIAVARPTSPASGMLRGLPTLPPARPPDR